MTDVNRGNWLEGQIVANRTGISVLALLILGVGVSWATESFTATERVEFTTVHDPWAEHGTFSYRVPVQRDAPIKTQGGSLGMGEPGYFTTVSPVVDITFRWRLEDETSGQPSPAGTLTAVVERPGRDGWRFAQDLARPAASVSDGELVLTGALDLRELARVATERNDGEFPNDARWSVRADVAFAAGPRKSGPDGSSFEMPFTFDSPLYILPDEETARIVKDHAQRESVVKDAWAGPSGLVRAPAGPILILLGLAGAALAWRAGAWRRSP